MPPRLAGVETGMILRLEIKYQTGLLSALLVSTVFTGCGWRGSHWCLARGVDVSQDIKFPPWQRLGGCPLRRKVESICRERVPQSTRGARQHSSLPREPKEGARETGENGGNLFFTNSFCHCWKGWQLCVNSHTANRTGQGTTPREQDCARTLSLVLNTFLSGDPKVNIPRKQTKPQTI